jgi:hypothetical protein
MIIQWINKTVRWNEVWGYDNIITKTPTPLIDASKLRMFASNSWNLVLMARGLVRSSMAGVYFIVVFTKYNRTKNILINLIHNVMGEYYSWQRLPSLYTQANFSLYRYKILQKLGWRENKAIRHGVQKCTEWYNNFLLVIRHKNELSPIKRKLSRMKINTEGKTVVSCLHSLWVNEWVYECMSVWVYECVGRIYTMTKCIKSAAKDNIFFGKCYAFVLLFCECDM